MGLFRKISVLLAILFAFSFVYAETDVNVFKIDSYPDTALPQSFSYARDGNLTIDFNVFTSDGNSLLVDINYATLNTEANGNVLLKDYNLSNAAVNSYPVSCEDTDFTDVTRCSYDFNINSSMIISDGNYYLLMRLVNTTNSANDFNVSDNNFMIDNTKALTGSWDANAGWLNYDENIHLSCTDANSGCATTNTTTYRIDTDPTIGVSMPVAWVAYDTNILFDDDGNYAVDVNSTDMAGNIGDANRFYVLIDKTKPSTYWDGNKAWQKTTQSITLTCRETTNDANSGCLAPIRYRLDTDPTGAITYGAWANYVGPISIANDGNWAIDFNSTDNAGNIGDENVQYVSIDKNAPYTMWDGTGIWQSTDANIHISCVDVNMVGLDANAGCASVFYRVDQDPTNVINMGAWTTYDANVLFSTDGNYAIDMNAYDLAGNMSDTNRFYVLIDSLAPSTYWDGNKAWQKTTQSITLTCRETTNDANSGCLAPIRYRLDTDPTGAITYGAWANYVGPISIANDGNWAIDFNSTDNAGNIGDENVQYVSIDKNAPYTMWDGTGIWQSTDANIHISCVDVNMVGLDANAGCASVFYRVDQDPTNVINMGAWTTYDANVLFSTDGNYAIDMNAYDLAGNMSDTNRFYVLIDSLAPSTYWDGNKAWQKTTQSITLTCRETTNDANSGCLAPIRYRLDTDPTGAITYGAWANYVGPISIANDGNWAIDFNSTDNAGNIGDENVQYVSIDKNAPYTMWDGNASTWQTTDANVHISCVDVNMVGLDANAGCASVYYRVDGDPTSTVTMGAWLAYDANVLFSTDGNYAIDMNAYDLAGNMSDTNRFYVLIDSTAPSTSWSWDVNNNSWKNGAYASITFTCSDGVGSGCAVTNYRYDTDGTDANNMSGWQVGLGPLVIASDGNLAVEFYSTDSAGNTVGDYNRGVVLVDRIAPTNGYDLNVDVNKTGVISGTVSTDIFLGLDQNLTLRIQRSWANDANKVSPWQTVQANFSDLNSLDNTWYSMTCDANKNVCIKDYNVGSFDLNFSAKYPKIRITDQAGNTSSDINANGPVIMYSMTQPPGLDGNSTNFQTITNFAAIPNMVFSPIGDLGKVTFNQDINLSTYAQAVKLIALSTAFSITAITGTSDKEITIDPAVFADINKSAVVTIYHLPIGLSASQVGLLKNDANCGAQCPVITYNGTTGQLDFNVVGWSTYESDTNGTTITVTNPAATVTSSSIVTLVATTNKTATCKYSTTNQSYAAMTAAASTAGTSHSFSLGSLSNASYTYYMQCRATSGVDSNTSYSFTVNVSSGSGSSGTTGTTGSVGGGSSSGGSSEATTSVIELSNIPATADEIREALGELGLTDAEIEKAITASANLETGSSVTLESGNGTYKATVTVEVTNPSTGTSMKNVKIIIEVPKGFAQKASEIRWPAGMNFKVLRDDPAIEVTIDEIMPGETAKISYYVNKYVSESVAKTIPKPIIASFQEVTPVSCNDTYCGDSNPCTYDYCNAGQCSYKKAADGAKCGTDSICQTGTCVKKAPEFVPRTEPVGQAVVPTAPKQDYTTLAIVVVVVFVIGGVAALMMATRKKKKGL